MSDVIRQFSRFMPRRDFSTQPGSMGSSGGFDANRQQVMNDMFYAMGAQDLSDYYRQDPVGQRRQKPFSQMTPEEQAAQFPMMGPL